ncbi:TPA: hypothetical protein QFT02_002669 [Raoultella ornithinolytica]|uniref:Uncharacterized protein n=1 Tax=Klebsiella pneumoniae subsp. pneumoniae TaxID=72407 RepID=A0A377ZEA9_KLEPN|nr:hypothetical protein [Raoultella ornithinolytica]STU67783.1 Uncharacterised protein [Klebsiella pneumoniae subsp. pneumoniae]STW52075.1 Uncharacterised protein [Klebsiella pneumoniae]HDT6582438.1 hypothetical protein [Raoultella ornithinolytica]
MKLFSPLSYLRIKHEEKKWYDYRLPIAGATIVALAYYFLPNKIPLIGGSGLLLQVNGLLQVLIGFYIAALAAVSTFSNATIDEVMAGDPPTLVETYRGQKISIELTRRRFVCYLFGYLALVSFVQFCVGLISILIGKSLGVWVVAVTSVETHILLKAVFLWCYSVVLLNIITTTLLGLYFLSVRFHQSSL